MIPSTDYVTKREVAEMRQFATGATRNVDDTKYDPEGFINPLVIDAFNAYMHKHRFQADGKMRASDNWQKGIPREAYMKSLWRHFLDLWLYHRGLRSKMKEPIEEALPALMFNVMGYYLEVLLGRDTTLPGTYVRYDPNQQPTNDSQ